VADKFKLGDVVRLKSGGPNMTIEKYGNYSGERKCVCKWFDGRVCQVVEKCERVIIRRRDRFI
jgi:uncharacterized protein YodC (DUF2158 family)